MEQVKLSVIIPVYNVEKYLEKCLDSLVNQNVEGYELIVVNDGTKDNSQLIIDRFAKEYPNIVKAYIKKNGGLSDARNFGLQYANGKFVTFFDGDDYASDNYLKNMLDCIGDDVDLVVSNIEYIWENDKDKHVLKEGINPNIEDIHKAVFLSHLSVCNKLFNKSLFEKLELQFPVGLWYEDIPVTLKYCSNCKNIIYNNNGSYYYVQHDNSILNSDYSPKMHDIFTIFEMVLKNFKQDNKFNEYKDELEYLAIEHLLLYGGFRFLRTNHYAELLKKSFAFMKKEFPNYLNNKYLKDLNSKNKLYLYTNNSITMHLWRLYFKKN